MSRRVAEGVLVITVIVAFVLRVWNLGERSIWFDEAFSWTLCTEFGPLEIIQRTGEDVHPPFYYLILWAWVGVFGDSLWTMRFLSVVCGTATVWMASHVGREAVEASSRSMESEDRREAGDLVGLMFAMLVASSAFQIHWSGEVRMYALLSLLFLLSVFFGLRALNQHRASSMPLIGFTVSSALMLYTHNYGLFSFVAICVSLAVLAWWRERSDVEFHHSRMLGRVILAAGVAGLLFVPWIPSLLHQRSQVAANYWISRFSLTQLAIAWDGVIFPENRYGPWQKTRGEIALAITAAVLLLLQIRARAVDVLSLMLTAIPAFLAVGISMASSSIIAYRLFVLIHLSALLAIARGLQKWLEPPAAIVFAAVLMADGLWVHGECVNQLDLGNRPGPRGAIEWLDSVRGAEDPVFVLHPCAYFSLRYHSKNPDQVVLCTTPENVVHYTGKPILQADERQELEELVRPNSNTVWVIDCTGYSAGYQRPMLPEKLKFKREKRFRSPYTFEGDLIVTEYQIDNNDAATQAQ